MTKMILVSQFDPDPLGHGGNHRTYQIVHDLAQVVGGDNVVVVSWAGWRKDHSSLEATNINGSISHSRMDILRQIGKRIGPLRNMAHLWGFLSNLFGLVTGAIGVVKSFSLADFKGYYRGVVQEIEAPAVCIIEHIGFADLLSINAQAGMPTIACIQNLESFDHNILLSRHERRNILRKAIDFANEFSALAQCDERLFISKVETGLIGGLGLRSHYYPYMPVGRIRERLQGVRRTRQGRSVEKNLFLMLGSCHHYTTRQSFSWFVRQARENGLPDGIRVVIGGRRTDQLLRSGVKVPGIEVRGWLAQDELDCLLINAQGVLAPQLVGFGALTRLPELSCAGIPVIASEHSVYAIEPPPGIEVVGDAWDEWYAKIEGVATGNARSSAESYQDWEKNQHDTLQEVVRCLIPG